MNGKKVGWLILPDEKGRQYTKKRRTVRKKACGLSGAEIIESRLKEEGYEVNYVSPSTMNRYGLCFASVVSAAGYIDLLRVLPSPSPKTRLFVGGAGMLNVEPLRGIAYCAVIGRWDKPMTELIDGTEDSNVIYFERWNGEKKGIGQPKQLYPEAKEQMVGCPRKCAFCYEGWRYHGSLLSKAPKGHYAGGLSYEDFLPRLEFSPQRGRYSAGLDGFTEKERWVVDKACSNEKLRGILEKTDVAGRHVVLKLYNIHAYPFTTSDKDGELLKVLSEAGRRKSETLTIVMSCTHFVPVPCTPMENEPVKIRGRYQVAPRQFGRIKFLTYIQSIGYGSAILQTALYRAQGEEAEVFRRMLRSPQLWALNKGSLRRAFDKYLPGIYDYKEDILPWLQRPWGMEKAKKEYYVRAYGGGKEEMSRPVYHRECYKYYVGGVLKGVARLFNDAKAEAEAEALGGERIDIYYFPPYAPPILAKSYETLAKPPRLQKCKCVK